MAGKTRGPRSKLTRDLETRLVNLIRTGVPLGIACPATGVDDRTVRTWRTKAEAGDARCREFIAKLDRARAEAQAGVVVTLRKAANTDWRAGAWLLERTNWAEFGPKMPATVDGQKQEPLQVTIVTKSTGG